MKITVTSQFHNNLTRSFIGLKPGYNHRYYDHGECECGFPCERSGIECPEGFEVGEMFSRKDYVTGKNEIVIRIDDLKKGLK